MISIRNYVFKNEFNSSKKEKKLTWIIKNKIAALDLETSKNYDIPIRESADFSLSKKIKGRKRGSDENGLL